MWQQPFSVIGSTPLATATRPSLREAQYALFVLWLIHAMSNVDRFSIGLIVPAIQADLGLSDTQVGLFVGAAFVVAYVVAGIPMAYWLDRGVRTRILAGSVAIGSLLTAACGAATNFVQLLLARAGVGAGESTTVPGSLSLIADYFPLEKRSQAIGIFHSGLPAAGIVGTPLVGILADQFGWRFTLVAMAIVGLALAALAAATLREPMREAAPAVPAAFDPKPSRNDAAGTFLLDLRAMFAQRAFRYLLIAHGLYGIGIFAFVTWYGITLVRNFGMTYTELGLFAGTFLGIVMFVTTIGSGYLGPAVVRWTGNERWMANLPAIYAVLSVPALLIASLDVSLTVAMAAGTVAFALTIARVPLLLTLSMNLMPASMRSRATLVFLLTTNIIGSAIGPLIVGMISDALAPELGAQAALRHALLWTVPTFCLLGGLLAFLPARHMARKVAPH